MGMAAKKSAGILVYRRSGGNLEVFLVHPGGPFFKNKDNGAWSIPKGELHDDEDALEAAKREFSEETGQTVAGSFVALSPIKQKGGKIVLAWALEGDCSTAIRSNVFSIEWPPKSGKQESFPEIDRAAWFGIEEAKLKINSAQRALLEELQEKRAYDPR